MVAHTGIVGRGSDAREIFWPAGLEALQFLRDARHHRRRRPPCEFPDFSEDGGPILHGARLKNPLPSPPKIRTSVARSRYLLPRSQQVSGRNMHAWQAA